MPGRAGCPMHFSPPSATVGGLPAGRVDDVTPKVWTAAELERLSPEEQDRVFESSLVTDLNAVPAEFLARVRARVEARIAASDSTPKA